MLQRPPLHDDTIRDLCYRRSAHFRMLLRAWHLAIDLPCDEVFFRLARHFCARFEIAQDLHTYAEDVDDDAFNLLRLEVWSHGPRKARAELDTLHRRIVADLHHELDRTPRRTLLTAIPAFLTDHRAWFLPFLPGPALRRYAHRRLHQRARLTEGQALRVRAEIPRPATTPDSPVEH